MFALGHRHSPVVKLFFEILRLDRVTKSFITLLYIIVGLPGWPNGAGGGLQTRYNVGSIPTPGSKI